LLIFANVAADMATAGLLKGLLPSLECVEFKGFAKTSEAKAAFRDQSMRWTAAENDILLKLDWSPKSEIVLPN
jgi:hypothetical protein